jgi:hypothetical protein
VKYHAALPEPLPITPTASFLFRRLYLLEEAEPA